MKLLITGASGFIGSRLIDAVIRDHGRENVIAIRSTPDDRCRSITYDPDSFRISDEDSSILAEIDVLIHAGAFTPKRGSEANVLSGCNGNIAFTDALLGLSLPDLKRVVYLSTLDVYAPAEQISEATPTSPSTLYGHSKLYCEKMVAAFAREQSINYQILRIGHVYGPGEEKYAKFLPIAMRNIVAGVPVELWGDGSELRSPIYIDDVVEAIINAASLDAAPEIINVTSGSPISIRDLLDKLIAISGKEVEIIERESSGEKRDLVFDNRRCQEHLLNQETEIEVGLRAEYAHFESLR